MTTWHWVRHGPTHAKNFVGWRDVPADLSDRAQIERLRAYLPDRAVLVSSDLTRTRATADALSQPTHLRLPPNPHLREIHFGLWDGMHFEDVSARDPALSRAFWETPGAVKAPYGESWDAASERVNAAVNAINARFPAEHVIAVAHFGVILTQVQRALGLSAYDTLSHKIDNYSVTQISWSGAAGEVAAINHLP